MEWITWQWHRKATWHLNQSVRCWSSCWWTVNSPTILIQTNDRQKSHSYPFAQEYSILIFPQINPCISVGRFLNDSKRSHDIQEFLIRVIAASIKVAVELTSVLSLPVTMDPDKSSTQFRYSPEFESEGFKQQVESYKLSLCGRKLTWAIATVTGTGFTLFGCASTIMSIKMLTGL